MTKWILAAGAAALAITSPALAKPGNGGGDTGQHGGGGGKAQHGGGGGGGGGGPARAEHGHGGQQAMRGGNSHNGGSRMVQAQHGHGGGKQAHHQVAQADRGHAKAAKADTHGNAHATADRGHGLAKTHGNSDRRLANSSDVRVRDDGRIRNDGRFGDDVRFGGNDVGRRLSSLGNGCPPGLAMKNNGCLPPGQAKKMVGALLPAALGSSLLDGPYRQWYRDNDQYYYRDDGNYIYRVNRDGGLVDALFPFQDRDYSYYPVGMTYPSDYDYYNVPYQYRSFYPDGDDYNYRYGDGAIYQVNRSTNAIDSIVALLAGDLSVGQPLPADYGVYNVPMAYRDRYYDTPDALYRYNDGYIYQADPKTQLITAVIDALV